LIVRTLTAGGRKPKLRLSRPQGHYGLLYTTAIWFKKDDRVVLTGLKNRGEMNGNTARVVSVDYVGSKALVKVEELDRTFKIKLENLKMQEDVEELE
jgi:hypothetical protein